MLADRRLFLRATGTAFAALAASGCMRPGVASAAGPAGYGPLAPDPNGLIDLPAGFSYRMNGRSDAAWLMLHLHHPDGAVRSRGVRSPRSPR